MRKRCALNGVGPHETCFDGIICAPQVALEPVRALRLVKSGTVEIVRYGCRCGLRGVPDIHHQLAGTTVRWQLDTRSIRPVDGNPTHGERTARGWERSKCVVRRLTIGRL